MSGRRNVTAVSSVNLIRDQISKIEQSGALGGAKSAPVRLLRYLIEEELAGRGDRIKAYSIGLDVLDKGQDFDPANDSSVRVTMHRLRVGLNLYYDSSSTDGEVVIAFPLQRYRPEFEFPPPRTDGDTDHTPPKSLHEADKTQSRTLLLLGLGTAFLIAATIAAYRFIEGRDPPIANFSPSATISLDQQQTYGAALAHIRDTIDIANAGRFPVADAKDGDADYILTLSSTEQSGKPALLVTLHDSTSRLIAARYFPVNDWSDEGELTSIASQLDGLFFAEGGYVQRHFLYWDQVAPARIAAYRCYMDSHPVFGTSGAKPEREQSLLDCLEPAQFVDDEDKAIIHLARARLMMDSAASRRELDRKYTAGEAWAEFAAAEELSHGEDYLLQNEISLEWFDPARTDARLKTLADNARRMDMSDPLLLAAAVTYAYYLDEPALAEAAIAEEYARPGSIRPVSSSLLHFISVPGLFLQADYPAARRELQETGGTSLATYAVFALAIGCAMDDKVQVTEALKLVSANRDLSTKSIEREIRSQYYHKDLEAALLTALSRPGCRFTMPSQERGGTG